MRLGTESLHHREWFAKRGVALPRYDVGAMIRDTQAAPRWAHMGAGNIFRAFAARMAQTLLDKGLVSGGITVWETFDQELIQAAYAPGDNLSLLVTLPADREPSLTVIASVAQALDVTPSSPPENRARMRALFGKPSLQMVSLTITEKGYMVADGEGNALPPIFHDIREGPQGASSTIGLLCAGLLERFEAGGYPLALVSMDNCALNGDRLKAAVGYVLEGWREKGFIPEAALGYIQRRVSFPLTMIDKITPRPDPGIAQKLHGMGLEGMEPLETKRHTHTALYVNAEDVEYLVVEDDFPGGRPPLEEAGALMADRQTVNRVEQMKVSTCLNPLHTALALLGCLLGYERISQAMKDAHLVALLHALVYDEGMPVVTDPGVLSPRAFAREVLEKRFVNPYVPDTPQRIATDTSQKIPVRYGETVKHYLARGMDTGALDAIPLILAAYFRYLKGLDDGLKEMPLSPDPRLEEMGGMLRAASIGAALSREDIAPALEDAALLGGVSIRSAGLEERVMFWFARMMAGKGAVRAALEAFARLHPIKNHVEREDDIHV